MAERRMFAKKITESDAFLDMPSSTQMLYFHLSMNADDDGFVNNPKKIQRMCGASDDDFKLLIAKNFVLLFDSGIIVIKHWKMHNYIQSDRYKPTDYVEEKSMLGMKKNKSYTLTESKMYTKCIQDVSVGKDSIGKDSILLSNSNELDCQTQDVRRALETWNELGAYGIKTVGKLKSGTQRYQMLQARIREYGIDDVLTAISNVSSSDFLQGKHGGKPWQITFDWFVRPNNFPKVLDGNYNNDTGGIGNGRVGTNDTTNERDSYADEFERMLEE